MSLRQRQRELAREQIKAAAEELFLKDGYVGTPVTAIARKAGVAEKTVYNHFQSKGRLLLDVFHSRVLGQGEDSLEVVHEKMKSFTDPDEMIDFFCENEEEVASRAILLLRVILEAVAVDNEIAELHTAQEEFRYQHQADLLHALQKHGHLRTDLPFEELQGSLWLAAAPELHVKALDAGWDARQMTEWKKRVLKSLLLPDRSQRRP